jgi:hypothetical protein
MPHSKSRLDETAKAARRQETLQRYAIKYGALFYPFGADSSLRRNRKKLRVAAQERMQR